MSINGITSLVVGTLNNQSAEGTEGAVRMFNAILTKWGVKFKGNIDVY